MTRAICMAKASRSGKPLPHAATSSPAGTPMVSPATKTATVAASAKTNASGSQRSASRVSASAMRDRRPSIRSRGGVEGDDRVGVVEQPGVGGGEGARQRRQGNARPMLVVAADGVGAEAAAHACDVGRHQIELLAAGDRVTGNDDEVDAFGLDHL